MIRRIMSRILFMPKIGVASIIIVSAVLASWSPSTIAVSTIQSFASQILANCDSVIHELNIRNGRILSPEKHQRWTYFLGTNKLHLVIDTRDVKFHELIGSVNNVDQGIVLSRDLIILKYQVRIFLLGMPRLPDAVINSHKISEIIPAILPIMKSWLVFSIILFVLVLKTLEVAFLGLLTFLLGQGLLDKAFTFKQSVNLAAVAMIPPVAVHCVIERLELQTLDNLLIYFGVYILALTFMIIAVGPGNRGKCPVTYNLLRLFVRRKI